MPGKVHIFWKALAVISFPLIEWDNMEVERGMKNRAILSGIVMLLTVLSAFAAMPATQAAAEDSGTLYIAMQQDIPDFNNWNLASNSVWKANVINWGFESLSGLDYNMMPYYYLAESWDFYQNNYTVIVHLREGVMFHDQPDYGYEAEEMTAEDVVFTYHAARHGTTYASNIINAFDTDGVEVGQDEFDGVVTQEEIEIGVWEIDDYTVGMKMGKPYGQFFTSTLGVPIVPMSIWNTEDGLNVDGTFNVLWNDELATVGTGPWKYKEGESNIYRIMERNEDYWGKDFETPAGYKLYAPNVMQIYYKIYASIDTAILALQAGNVDHIAWAITAGRVPSLQSDPNIELEYLEDNGYFYLAFNEKMEPMNMLPFRKAVSYLIDKEQIVNVYMGGFGSKGTAVEPPYWDDWMNESVESYPYDDPFDGTTTIPEDMLDDAGLVDLNGDGWRDLPDGRPMEKIIILTPPADYDPIRIRAGQMIAKNMREIGLNAEAKAIDFDTLVARLNSMAYQMLIIGWSLASDPVYNVFDIIGPKSSGNTFGFWTEDDPNPFYADLLGVNTLADAETQDLAREVQRLGGLAQANFTVEGQMMYTRWGQGVIADAVPCNVLYYRVNILAHSTRWTGWLPFLGDVFGPGANPYSLANLELSAAGGAAGGVTESVNVALSIPNNVGIGNDANGYVMAVNNMGSPVSGAAIALSSSSVDGGASTVTISPASGTTDADGVMEFTITGASVGYSFVDVTATVGTIVSDDRSSISSVEEYPATLYLAVTPEQQVLMPGDTTVVNLDVFDGDGDPVAGANVSIDLNLVSYGTIQDDVEWILTDASGHAEMTYIAPTTIPDINTHLTLTLSYAVAKEGYSWTNEAAANLLVYNDAAPDWVMARVTDVATTALNSGANTTSIDVEVVDDEGNALADHALAVSYSDESMVFDPVISVVTDGTGVATVDIQLKDMADSGALKVTIVNNTVLNAVAASVTLTYVGTTAPTATMYGGYITFTEVAQYMEPLESVEATVMVWDQDGVAADGINASLVLSATPYGSLVWNDDINWDTLWDYLGVSIVTGADDGSYVTSGPMNTWFDQDNYDEWMYDTGEWLFWDWGAMTGVDITGGSYTFTIYGVGVAHTDLLGSIYFVPEGLGFFNDTTYGYQIDGQTSIVSEYVIGRSYEVVTATYEIADPVMAVKLSDFDTTTVTGWVTDQNGDAVQDADLNVYQNGMTGNAAYGVELGDPTDATGESVATVTALGRGDVVSPASIRADLYVNPVVEGAVSMFAQTHIFMYVQRTFASIEAIYDIQDIGSWDLNVSVDVVDFAGDPVSDLTVKMTVDIGEVTGGSLVTDSEGMAWFLITTPTLEETTAAFMMAQFKAVGPGYEISVATAKIALQNMAPSVFVTMTKQGTTEAIVSGGSIVLGTNLSVTANAFDANGLQAASIVVDGTSTVIPGAASGTFGDQQRSYTVVLTGLSLGSHTVTVNATDALGVMSESAYTFEVVESTDTGDDTDSTLWIVLAAVGWIVAAIAIVLLLMKTMKPKAGPTTMAPGEPEIAKEEEELTPSDKE